MHRSIQLALLDEDITKWLRLHPPSHTNLAETSRIIYGTPRAEIGDLPGRVRVRHADLSPLPPGEDTSGNFALAKKLAALFGKKYSAGSAWFPAEPFTSKKYAESNVVFFLYQDADGGVMIVKEIYGISNTP